MAIKVKHDMNAAPAAASGLASGRAKRSVEAAKMFASGTGGSRGGGTTGAQAHPVAPMGAHAQLTHASTPAVQAHAPAYHDTIDDRMRLQEEQNHAAMERQQMGLDWDKEKLASQQEFTKYRDVQQDAFQLNRDFRLSKIQTERDAALAKQRQDEWDRQHGILRQERDADLIAAGTHEYGYSPEVQREYDRLQREYDEGLQKGRYLAGSDDERRFMDDMDRKIAALPKTLVQRKDPEGLFRNNTFTDEQGRIFTTDGKLMYNPADAETRRMEFQQRQMDAEEKRYIDTVMKLQQGYRTSEPVYKMDELGKKPIVDENGNPIVEKWESVYKPYTPEQQEATLGRLFPSRFAYVQPEPAAQPAPTAQQPAAQQTSQAQPVIRQDSQGVSWEVVFDENGKPIGKRRR